MAVGLTEPTAPAVAREPNSVEETGLDLAQIADLVLKFVYYNNQTTAQAISDEACLPFYHVVDKALTLLKREELVEVSGSHGFGELAYQYSVTPKGVARVQHVMERTSYVGPAPIRLEHYTAVAAHQAIADLRISPRDAREATADLVLAEAIVDAMGQASTPAARCSSSARPATAKRFWSSASSRSLAGRS